MHWRDADREDVEFVTSLQLAIEREGCGFTIYPGHRAVNSGFEPVRKMAGREPPDAWAIYQGGRRLIEECRLAHPRTLALGGAVADLDMDVVAWDGGVLVKRSLEILLKAGHRRIVLPLVKTWKDGEHRGVAAFYREMREAGIAVQPSFHLPVVPGGASGFREMLERLWRWTPPTAFIVQTASQAVEMLCFAGSRGLSVPEDLSVIALCSNPLLRELRPSILGLAVESSKLVPHVVNWFVQPPAPARKVLLYPSLGSGDSVGPPPRGN
ncbi:substrate-binding domain-containing protein [Luteolibacter sp. LG18]|uniref:substrate-binding domain-containing protein n=1 Tax=Luteolibacter sp. LG18 TaxID=2819286 RepID=UPI0030C77B83